MDVSVTAMPDAAGCKHLSSGNKGVLCRLWLTHMGVQVSDSEVLPD